MIGLDTNILVRYFADDDPVQSARATDLIESLSEADPGFVSLVTVIEVYWVLRRTYAMSADECRGLTGGLLDAREIKVGHDAVVRAALDASRNTKADFADAVIVQLGTLAGCAETVTFDRRAAKSGLMRLLDR